ncbi:MAG: BREX system ATP-binding domain-containing protein, partial [Desulfosudaceae bacterium]
RLREKGVIEPFLLAAKDINIHFTLPRRLIGRDQETAQLLNAFRRVESGNLVFFVIAGDAGAGKTFFLAENRKAVEARNGFACAGAFEVPDQAIPYSGFITAFQDMLNQLLTESAERIAAWRENLLASLGPGGRLLTDIIPELALIIGEQPEVPDLDSEEARNRFNFAFKNFIRVFARKSHPLTLILDDLHLADPASLDLLSFLAADPDLQYFFIVGSYRSDAPDIRALHQALEKIRERASDVEELTLAPFDPVRVNAFVAHVLQSEPGKTESLSAIIHRKTNGMPFFMAEFVGTIHKQGLLKHEAGRGWHWDAEAISRLTITDNVVEIMVEKIRNLPAEVLETLKTAACIGSRFDLEALAQLLDRPLMGILDDVARANAEDLIRQEGQDYRFQHEKIREAAYSLINESERPGLHRRIGELMLARAKNRESGIKDEVFYIVRHLNAGAEALTDPDSRFELAWLNYLAGEKAKSSTAYGAAGDYFSRAVALMPENQWTAHYDFAWSLHMALAETLFLTGRLEEADRIFDALLANARDNLWRAEVYGLMVMLNTAVDKPDKALEIGLRGLELLGIKIPKNPGKLTILWNILRVRLAQGRTRTEDLANLPALTDPHKKAIMHLFSMIGAPAYYMNPTLFAVTITRGVLLSLRHGLPDLAAYGMIAMGLIMGSRMGFYNYGYRLGASGLEVMKRFNDVKSFARSYFIYAYFILPWCEHARNALPYLSLAYQYGMETGDIVFTGHSINVTAAYRIFAGQPLDTVFEEHQTHKAFLEQIDSPFILNNYLDTYEIVTQLKGTADQDEEHLRTKWDVRQERLQAIEDENLQLGMFIHYVKRKMIMFFFDDFTECWEISRQAEEVVEYGMGTMYVSEHYFFWCLAATALYPEGTAAARKDYARVVKKCLKKYRRWSRSCPENFLHKQLLMQAEWARVRGKRDLAARRYHEALVSARESDCVHNVGLTGELAARFYFSIGYEEIGRAYIIEARNAYHRWGASAKVRRLEQLYPDVGSILRVRTGSGSETSSTITASVIDLSTLRKSLKTIAEEKIHSLMLEKVIRSSVEFAGAEKGMLILRKQSSRGEEGGSAEAAALDIIDSLFVEAEWLVETRTMTLMQSIPVREKENLSRVALNYVARSGRSVVVHNAQEPQQLLPKLQSEPYIRENGVKSLLCLPIIATAGNGELELIGLFYFENNLTSHAFTRERLETLEIISLSAAGRLELSRKAVTDGLTELYNHDYFQNMLQQEVLLAKRKGRALSMVMIDIDHFKHFNDSWGHQAGDLVLKEVAATIRESCRGSDIVARYGGEEIALLLHETPPKDAFNLAESIRKKIESLRITYQNEEQLHVTISLGVAGFPTHARDRKNL